VLMRWAFVVSLVAAGIMPFIMGEWKPMVSFGLLLAFWVIASIFVSISHRLRNGGEGGLFTRLAKQPRGYYGMHCAHLGIAVFIIGVTLVNGYETEKDVRMEVGSTVTLKEYTFQFNGTKSVTGPNYNASQGQVEVFREGKKVSELQPEKRTYTASGMPMTEAAVDMGLLRDLYVALGEPLENGAWIVRVYHKPFVNWIWLGCMLMALGGALAASDRRYRLAIGKKSRNKAASGPVAPETADIPAGSMVTNSVILSEEGGKV